MENRNGKELTRNPSGFLNGCSWDQVEETRAAFVEAGIRVRAPFPCRPAETPIPFHRRKTLLSRDSVVWKSTNHHLFQVRALRKNTFRDDVGVAAVTLSFSPSAFRLESEWRWTPQLNWSIPSSFKNPMIKKKKRVRISYIIIYQFNYLLIPLFFWIWL